jgi:hypothetical protein
MIERAGEQDRSRRTSVPLTINADSTDGIFIKHCVYIANAKNSFPITRKTRFLKKTGFPDLSGKNFYHIQKLY